MNIKLVMAPPQLYPKQREAIYCPERWGFIEASTKAGKTMGCLSWLYDEATLGKENDNYWWVAPVYTQADIAYKRMKSSLPRDFYKYNDSKRIIKLVGNGAYIHFKSGEIPDNLYGDDVKAAVIDEASRLKKDSWYAVRSTLTATRGKLRAIGNVKGRKNWFYELCRQAQQGKDGWKYSRLTANDAVDAGVIARAEIEDAKNALPKHIFEELYMAKPSDDGGNPFGLESIEACVIPELANGPVASWGIDLAKSHDWTVLIGLNARGDVCAFHRWQKPWRDTIRNIVEIVGDYTPALVDSTGVGDAVIEELQNGRPNFEGFKFTATSKQQLMEGLAVAIQKREVRFPRGVIVDELEVFEYEYTRTGVRYSAPEGLHDDCVCALALARRREKIQIDGMGHYEFFKQQYEQRHKINAINGDQFDDSL